jgi:pyrroloquinoline quinone (PQQ) biosynthesis protein C
MGVLASYTFTNVTAPHTISATFAADVIMPVYRFYQVKNSSHFYTASLAERDQIIAKLSATYRYEGVAYSVNMSSGVNTTPLFRFYNKKNGAHFYTASLAERDQIIATLSATYTFEGVAYNVSANSYPDPILAVYRFYNMRNGTHFYTASPAERDTVIATLSATYRYEGIAFNVGQ